MVKQRVTPGFMTESDMGTDTLPIVIESGKEEDRGPRLCTRRYNHCFYLVAVEFNLSLFTVIQVLTSSIHFCIVYL